MTFKKITTIYINNIYHYLVNLKANIENNIPKTDMTLSQKIRCFFQDRLNEQY